MSVGSLQPSVDTSRDTLDLAIRAASSLTLRESTTGGRQLRRPNMAREEGGRDYLFGFCYVRSVLLICCFFLDSGYSPFG